MPDRESGTYTAQQQAEFMGEALAESRKALPACLPNPPVGCVLVHRGLIVARGYTGRPGMPHAEAAALLALPPDIDPRETTAFVTLEPCAFVGRTPSCARALVAAAVPAVLVGTIDPDPRNNGAGLDIMRRAGVDVRVGLLEDLILGFLAPYLLSAPRA